MTKIKFVLSVLISFNLYLNPLFSQTHKLSIDLDYPLPINNQGITGELGLGIKYSFIHFSNKNIGISTDLGAMRYDNYYIRPRIMIDFEKRTNTPYFGIGYGITGMYESSFIGEEQQYDLTREGININAGTKIFLTNKIYINIGYDLLIYFDGGMQNIVMGGLGIQIFGKRDMNK